MTFSGTGNILVTKDNFFCFLVLFLSCFWASQMYYLVGNLVWRTSESGATDSDLAWKNNYKK